MRATMFGYLLKEGYRSLKKNLFMSAASILVLVSCLLITGCAYLVFENIDHGFDWAYQQNIVVAYSVSGATEDQNTEILNQLNALDNVKEVSFVSKEELQRDHAGIPHGGFVIRCGKTGADLQNRHIIEYSLKLDSNPEFTSSVLVAYARAAYRMSKEGQRGCKTVLDVPPAYLSIKTPAELRRELL